MASYFKSRDYVTFGIVLPVLGAVLFFLPLILSGVNPTALSGMILVGSLLVSFYSIYVLLWLISTNLEIKKLNPKAPTPWTIFFMFILGVVSGILLGIAMDSPLLKILFVIFQFFILLLWVIYLIRYSKYASLVTEGEVNAIISFFLLLFVPPIGLVYLQSIYNSIAKGEIEITSNFTDISATSNFTEINPLRDYILQYKSSFSREDIKNALLNAKYDELKVEEYLQKYYDSISTPTTPGK